jgi:hypothetical protein
LDHAMIDNAVKKILSQELLVSCQYRWIIFLIPTRIVGSLCSWNECCIDIVWHEMYI